MYPYMMIIIKEFTCLFLVSKCPENYSGLGTPTAQRKWAFAGGCLITFTFTGKIFLQGQNDTMNQIQKESSSLV